jgi:hypothetical protein
VRDYRPPRPQFNHLGSPLTLNRILSWDSARRKVGDSGAKWGYYPSGTLSPPSLPNNSLSLT